MVKKELVTGFIEAGAMLLAELDRQKFPVESMFWIHLPEQDYWRLIIASPDVAREGSLPVYRRLNGLLRAMDWAGILFDVISVVDPGSPQYQEFLSLARGSSRIFAGPDWVEAEEAIVYRWTGASVTGTMTCDLSLDQLDRVGQFMTNRPAPLITLNNQFVTLRVHPSHGPQQDLDGVKEAFDRTFRSFYPGCQIDWN